MKRNLNLQQQTLPTLDTRGIKQALTFFVEFANAIVTSLVMMISFTSTPSNSMIAALDSPRSWRHTRSMETKMKESITFSSRLAQ